MSQYSFIDCNYFKPEEKDKNIYNRATECSLEDISKNAENFILDPNISTIKIKNVEKGS